MEKEYTLQQWFKIRDAWNILYGLEFLNNYITVYKLQEIAQDIDYNLDKIQKGGECK